MAHSSSEVVEGEQNSTEDIEIDIPSPDQCFGDDTELLDGWVIGAVVFQHPLMAAWVCEDTNQRSTTVLVGQR
jgi:hypothetical protein